MNFTITLNGEGPDLANALRVLKGVMDGQSVLSGEVSATIAAAQPQQQEAPIYQQQAVTPDYQQQQYNPQQTQSFPQLQPQSIQQQAPIQQQNQQYQPQQAQYDQQPPINGGGVPLSTATYDMAQLSVAATQLMDAGRQQDLIQLLQSFGVAALTMLPKDMYGAFATQLRAMGAKI